MMAEEFSSINLYDASRSPTAAKTATSPRDTPGQQRGGRATTRVRPNGDKIGAAGNKKNSFASNQFQSPSPMGRGRAETNSFDELRKGATERMKSATKAFVEKGKIMQRRIRSLSLTDDATASSVVDQQPSSSSSFKSRSPGMLACSRCDRTLDQNFKYFCSECKHVYCTTCSSIKQNSANIEGNRLGVCAECLSGQKGVSNSASVEDSNKEALKVEPPPSVTNTPVHVAPHHDSASTVSRPKRKPFANGAESPATAEALLQRKNTEGPEHLQHLLQSPLATLHWSYTSSPVIDLNNTMLGRIDGGCEDESRSVDTSSENSFLNSPTRANAQPHVVNEVSSPVPEQAAECTAEDAELADAEDKVVEAVMHEADMPTDQCYIESSSELHVLQEAESFGREDIVCIIDVEADAIPISSECCNEASESLVSNELVASETVADDTEINTICNELCVKFGAEEVVYDLREQEQSFDGLQSEVDSEPEVQVEVDQSTDTSSSLNLDNIDCDVQQSAELVVKQESEPIITCPEPSETSSPKVEVVIPLLELDNLPLMLDSESKVQSISSLTEQGIDDSTTSSNETDSVMISPRVYRERYEFEPANDNMLTGSQELQLSDESSAVTLNAPSIPMNAFSPVSHSTCELSVALTPDSHPFPLYGSSEETSSNLFFVSPPHATHSLDCSTSPLCKDWDHINDDVVNSEDDVSKTLSFQIQQYAEVVGSEENHQADLLQSNETADEIENKISETIDIDASECVVVEDFADVEIINPPTSDKTEGEILFRFADTIKTIPIWLMKSSLLAIYALFFAFIAVRIAKMSFGVDIDPYRSTATVSFTNPLKDLRPTVLALGSEDLEMKANTATQKDAFTSTSLSSKVDSLSQPSPAPGVRYVFKLSAAKSKSGSNSILGEINSASWDKTTLSEGAVVLQRFHFWKYLNFVFAPLQSILRAPQRILSTSWLSLRRLVGVAGQ